MLDATRQYVRNRAENRCEYCLCPADFSPAPFSVEHIIPKTKGGSDDVENLAFACQGCNGRKYNFVMAKDPLYDNFVRLFHPRTDIWHNHFVWDTTATRLIALSSIGRATIERLKLNRKELVNLRKLLILIAEHPLR